MQTHNTTGVFQFESCLCQDKNTIGEEGHRKPLHKIKISLEKNSRALTLVFAKLKNQMLHSFMHYPEGFEI